MPAAFASSLRTAPWRGRGILLALCALALSMVGTQARAQLAPDIRLVVGAPAGGLADTAARLLATQLAASGARVSVEYRPGDGGREAARVVIQSFGDPGVLLVAENLTLALQDLRGTPLFNGLLPVAKLSTGVSTVLFARADGATGAWTEFIAAARRKRLLAASNGRTSDVSLPLAMIERRWGVRFQDAEVADAARITDIVAAGGADFGITTVDQLLAWQARDNGPADLAAMMTFGAERSPAYPDTPTLAELGRDRRLAFTLSFALYAPLGLAAGELAALRKAALAANDNATVRAQAQAARLPFVVAGPDVLDETLSRDRRIAAAIASALGNPR
ncbi:tripartite tricarboxylate transporter substrate-binding protein [Alsobacter sp. SYSU M60028]|uniref:Tripartite tricarboxylate transporter substrate-binding protein n=1 Tax=Alsobacter ponti TaxID=2962936 RepID=A0ABT1LET8_9HYPH|nr:tripartite tricarboxylate transporter substrate-binding protein [Alsobacter ponti]MCP8940017.1 tripartite tricarboxylate transporter substrate-binding protein [Alsobacter ponti]